MQDIESGECSLKDFLSIAGDCIEEREKRKFGRKGRDEGVPVV